VIQRSNGNPTRRSARRRYETVERLQIESNRDDPHVLVKIDTREMARQRRLAIATARSSLLTIGVLLVSNHQGWSLGAGAVLLAAFSTIPWHQGR
jgi:hypothetical protein